MRTLLFSLTVAFHIQAHAIPIYKTPDSSFSSGDAMVDSSLSPEDSSQTRTWFKLDTGEWRKRSEVLQPLDFSMTAFVKNNTLIHTSPRSTSLPSGTLKKNQKVSILKHQDIWVKVKSSETVGWIHQNQLEPAENEFGYVISKHRAFVKHLPAKNAKTVFTVKSQEKFKVLDIKEHWIRISINQNKMGWLNISDCFSKLDLLSDVLVYNPKNQKKWEKVSSINGSWIETLSLHFINIKKTLGLKLKKEHLLLREKNKYPIKIETIETVKWNQYYSDKTGLVWYPDKILFDNNSPQEVVADNNEIFQTDIFDMATHPLISDFKIVSKNGIYKTTDGKAWNKLIFFNSDNHPLAITRSGTVFVGPYVSHDAGETFKPYLRFDRLLRAFGNANQPLPQQFNLTKVDYDEMKAKLILQFNGNITLESSDSGKRWNFASVGSKKLRSSLSRRFLIRIDQTLLNQKSLPLAKSEHRRLATVFSY